MPPEPASFDELIQEISDKHGVTLSADDPILIVHTLMSRLLENASITQEQNLEQFKQELEALTERWKLQTTEKADKVLNNSLLASKTALHRQTEDFLSRFSQLQGNILSDSGVKQYKCQKTLIIITFLNVFITMLLVIITVIKTF